MEAQIQVTKKSHPAQGDDRRRMGSLRLTKGSRLQRGARKDGHGRGGLRPEALPDALYEELARAGHDARIPRSGAVFHAAVCRCLGVPVTPLDEKGVEFVNKIDEIGRAIAKTRGLRLRD